ncbi:MAG: hypothetical protein JSV10_04865 [Candidatus Zixiibacteriota bacterium]|nr:MAG: hypothetical protein JSV10_04865 [candidate division Zixibacteria bacterium]
MSGDVVHTWDSDYYPRLSAYLLETGHLLRTAKMSANPTFDAGGAGGGVEKIDWDGTVVWDFEYSTNQHCLHHDIEGLPNGNVLMVAWEYKTAAEAIAAGRDPALVIDALWPDHIIEVEPTGATGNIYKNWIENNRDRYKIEVYDEVIQSTIQEEEAPPEQG